MDSKKLAPRFVDPFEVVVNPDAIRQRLRVSMKVHPTFHVLQIKPVTESGPSPPADDHPPVWIIDGALAYMVERFLDVRCWGWQYLVEWEGYDPEQRL